VLDELGIKDVQSCFNMVTHLPALRHFKVSCEGKLRSIPQVSFSTSATGCAVWSIPATQADMLQVLRITAVMAAYQIVDGVASSPAIPGFVTAVPQLHTLLLPNTAVTVAEVIRTLLMHPSLHHLQVKACCR
jgi:hypothetical protein